MRFLVQIRPRRPHNRGRGAGRHPCRPEPAAIKARRRQHRDMIDRQFVNEPRRHLRLPLAVNAAVGSKGNGAKLFGARDADIGKAAFLLQPLQPAFVHRPLRREQPILPAWQEHRRKFQPLGRVQGHDADLFARFLGLVIHNQADMFEKTLQILEIFQRLDQFLEVFEPSRCLWRFVVLPKAGVAGFVQNDLGQCDMGIRLGAHLRRPAVQPCDQFGQFLQPLAAQQTTLADQSGAFHQGHATRARGALDRLDRLVAQAAFGGVDDAFKRQIIGGRHGQPEIGHRIADFHPFIESRPADHAVGQADGQKPVFKRAHLVAGAHQNRHTVQPHRRHATGAALARLDFFTDPACFFLAVPMADQADLFTFLHGGEQRLAQPALVGGNHA